MRYRERLVPFSTVKLGTAWWRYPWMSWSYPTSTYLSYNAATRAWKSIERTEDEIHPGPPYTSGGPFENWTFTDTATTDFKRSGEYVVTSIMPYKKYEGCFSCYLKPHDLFSDYSIYDVGDDTWKGKFGDVSSWGATAWRRFRPGRSIADVGVMLAEIRDIPRTLMKTASGFKSLWRGLTHGERKKLANNPKSMADHWLNTQFGWLPFVADVRNMYKAYNTLEKTLKQVERDNGQWIRRGGTVSEESNVEKTYTSSVNTTGHTPNHGWLLEGGGPPLGGYDVYHYERQRVWFAAKFRYYIPDCGSVEWRRRAIATLFGLKLTPEVLWEIVPFSWLVDWVSNTGDIISNLTPDLAQNLAAKYAYLMSTTEEVYKVVSRLNVRASLGGPWTDEWEFPIIRKTRIEASPFGFGLTGIDFSARQWSILSALGLSRSRYAY